MSPPGASPTRFVLGRRHLLEIGRLRVPSYTAMLYLGCVAGVLAGAAVAGTEGLDERTAALTIVVLLVPALVGARLWFVIEHLRVFREDPRRLWRRSDGGAALYGGLVGGVGASIVVLPLADLPFWPFWDAAVVTMLVGLILTRVGCLMNGCCGGRETAGRLGVRLPDQHGRWRRRYPTQLLEAIFAAVVLVGALAARPALHVPGTMFVAVVGAYAAGRLVLEPTRASSRDPRARLARLGFSALLLTGAVAMLYSGWR
ncbi:MAG: prolipoprotein diacylglyceryl transferase [Solirubrobacteraceae bacterium]